MKLVPRPNNEGTFDWVDDTGRPIATITLYEDGLVEFNSQNSKLELMIERIGTEEEQVVINKDDHVATVDQATITVARPSLDDRFARCLEEDFIELDDDGIYLFKIDDGSVDKDGKSNALYLVSCKASKNALRGEIGNQDHGGMPYEDWDRVIDNGEITVVKSLDDIPPESYGFYPYEYGGRMEDMMCPISQICQWMDNQGKITVPED